MSAAARLLRQLRDDWRGNARLRYGGMVIAAILGAQLLWMLSDQVAKRTAAYTGDLEMLARLESMRSEREWPARAKLAQATLQDVSERIPEVAGKGMAQAETQAWLSKLAQDQGLAEPNIKIEEAVDVDGYPELWQVLARLDGKLPAHGHEAFMRALAEALPWVQAERLEVQDGDNPRVVVTFRSYYRKSPAAAAEAAEAAAAEAAGSGVGSGNGQAPGATP